MSFILPAAGLIVVLCPEFLQNDLGIYSLMTNGPEPVLSFIAILIEVCKVVVSSFFDSRITTVMLMPNEP